MDQHVRHDLSAYLDDALPADRAGAVRMHVAGCNSCRADLAQLRETARLLAALPAAVPSRRLVPSLVPRFNWLRPLRSLSAVGAGMFLLVFMASATLDTGFRMGGGKAGTRADGPAAAPAGAVAPQADTRATFSATATPAGAPAALNASASPEKASQQEAAAASPGVPPDRNAATGGSGGTTGSGSGPNTASDTAIEPPQIGPSPWLWFALMVISAGIALGAHRRLRSP